MHRLSLPKAPSLEQHRQTLCICLHVVRRPHHTPALARASHHKLKPPRLPRRVHVAFVFLCFLPPPASSADSFVSCTTTEAVTVSDGAGVASPLDTPAPVSSILPTTDDPAGAPTTPEPTQAVAAEEVEDATANGTSGAAGISSLGSGVLLAGAAIAGSAVSAAVVGLVVFAA